MSASGMFSASTVLLLLLPALAALGVPAGGESRAPVAWAGSSSGLPTTANYFGVTFGDINGDGKPDVAGGSDGDGLRVFTGDGAGAWTAVAAQPATTGGYSEVRIGDMDNDGRMDLVAGSPGGETLFPAGIHLFRGDGAGNFAEITAGSGLPTVGYWRGIALGDVNGDGNTDIAATSGFGTPLGIHVFTGDGRGRFTDNSDGLPQNEDRPVGVVLADFNRDGNLDLAAAGGWAASCAVFLGNGGAGGAMRWTSSSTGLPGPLDFIGIDASDVDNDGAPDILLSGVYISGLRAYRNVDNASSWTNLSSGLPVGGGYTDVSAGDLDGDGNMEMVTGGTNSAAGLKVFYGNGTGGWVENSPGLPATDNFVGVDTADFNNDGNMDILAGSYSNRGLMVFRNTAPPLHLEVTEPAGNVSWSGGSRHAIAWNAGNGTLPYNVSLSYSTDGGASYPNAIAAGITQAASGTASYDWSVPAINSTTVRVRVEFRDAGNRAIWRTGGTDIEIDSGPPAVVSTEPVNGAVNVSSGAAVRIRFSEGMNRTASRDAVTISGPGNPVLSSASWTGDEVAFTPAGLLLGSTYAVTVSTAARDDSEPGNALAGASVFSFNTSGVPLPAITVAAPAGWEVWTSGSVHAIRWNATGGTGALTIALDLSTAGPGGPWRAVTAGEPDDGLFEWSVPDTPSTNCYVRATATDSGTPRGNGSAVSRAPFTIISAPPPVSVVLKEPNGGERWTARTRQNITWSGSGGYGALKATLQYSVEGPGGPWTDIIINGNDSGVHNWVVPNTPTASAIIRVVLVDGSSPPLTASDTSDAPFTIRTAPVPPYITLTAPNGGEEWRAGTEEAITWNATGGSGPLAIALEYSITGTGGPWIPIATGEANDGTYLWLVPDAPTADCFVRATATGGDSPPLSASDTGNSAFTIAVRAADTEPPLLRIDSPADGAVVAGRTVISISATDNVRVTKVEVFVDGVSAGFMTAAPFYVIWNTKHHAAGIHTITASAWDAAGNAGNATPVTVTVKNAATSAGGQSPAGAYLLAAVAAAAVPAAAVTVVMRRRRRNGGGTAT